MAKDLSEITIYDLAMEVYGDEKSVFEFLTSDHPFLEGGVPIAFILAREDSDGVIKVKNWLEGCLGQVAT